MKLARIVHFPILASAAMIVLACLSIPAVAVTFFVDDFNDPLLNKWNLTSGLDGTVATSGGQAHFQAAGNNDLGFGSLGLITKTSFEPTGSQIVYVYLWGFEHNSTPIPQRYLFGLTDGQATIATAATQIPFGMLGTAGQVQEALFRTPDGIDVNLGLAESEGGPFLQTTTPYDFRFVMQDVDTNTVIDLDYKLSSSGTWTQFINSTEGICCAFPADTATFYLSLSGRERVSDGTDLFIDAVQITDQDLTEFAQEINAAEITQAGIGDLTGITFQSSNSVNYSLESGPDTNSFAATPLLIQGDGNSLTVFDPGGQDTGVVYRITEVP
jgi:hypothetical protein